MRGGDRVTVLAPHAPGVRERWEDGGVEVATFRYAPERYEVLGYSRSLDSDERVRWLAGAVAPLYLLAARRALRRLVAQDRFDLVHAHWVVPNGPVGSAVAGRVPLAIGLHGSDVFLAERPAVRPWVRRVLGRSRLLTGCSPELVERVRRLGFDGERWRVIPYGVDPAKFRPRAVGEERARGRLGIPEDAVVALGVGRMVTKKGFHVLVEALPDLLERRPRLHLVLAGGGDRLEELTRTAARWPGRVHFPGAVPHDDLPELFRAADIFVLPAVHDPQGNVDGLPNVILEAMASGLPVVASGISGIPLAVEHEATGLLVPEGRVEPLAEALERLAGDPALRGRMGEAGRRKVERELTWEAIAARYRDAYREVVEAAAS